MIHLTQLREWATAATSDDGAPLGDLDEVLVRLGLAVSVTALDRTAIGRAIDRAFDLGATPAQVQEIVSLVSGLGVHSLMASAGTIAEKAKARGELHDADLTANQQRLWDQYVAGDPFWETFERELPGFLRSMLLLSDDQFEAFFIYCAVPWKVGTVRARLKELIAMACDATPAHRFAPGFRLHLANAVKLGAGRLAIDRTLDLAAQAPAHVGTD